MSSFELNIKIPTDFFNAFIAASKSRTETTVHNPNEVGFNPPRASHINDDFFRASGFDKAANQAPERRSSFTNNFRNEGLARLCLCSAEHGRNGGGSISFDNLKNPSGWNVRRSRASRQKTSPSESVVQLKNSNSCKHVEKGSRSVIDRCGTFFRNNILKVVLESKNGDEMKDKLPKVLLDATIQSLVDTVLGADSDAELRTYFTNKVIELLNDSDDDKTGTDSDKQNSEKQDSDKQNSEKQDSKKQNSEKQDSEKQNSEKQDSEKVTEENLQREKSFDYLLKIFGSILQLSEKEKQKNETVEENKDFTDEELSAIAKEVDQKVTADTPSDIPANDDQKESYVNIFGKLLSDNLGKIDKMEDKEKANPVDIFQTLLCDNLQKLGTKEGVEIGKPGSPFNILLTAFAGDKSEDVNAKSESNSFADVLGGLINLAEGKQEADPVSLFSKLFSTMHSKKPKDVEDKAESKPEVVVEDADDQLVDAADE